MFCICVLIIAAAAVYMVEAYIHTYYAIEYMHGAPLFFVLLAKYAAPVLFLLLCVYFVFRYREKRRESEKPAQDKPMNREEVYAEKINATVKTKAVFSDQADQMLYQVMRFGQKMAVAYSMTQDSKTSVQPKEIPKLMAKRKEHRQGRRHYRRCKRQRRAAAHGTLSKKCKKQDTAQGGNISKRAQTIGVFERNLPGCEKSVLCIGIKNKEARFNNRVRPARWLTPTANQLTPRCCLRVYSSRALPMLISVTRTSWLGS